ncbi:RmlC-like cupin [Atractiella rhizophila]|nr:RmlC-like cupin [Atractiella rhizophila]
MLFNLCLSLLALSNVQASPARMVWDTKSGWVPEMSMEDLKGSSSSPSVAASNSGAKEAVLGGFLGNAVAQNSAGKSNSASSAMQSNSASASGGAAGNQTDADCGNNCIWSPVAKHATPVSNSNSEAQVTAIAHPQQLTDTLNQLQAARTAGDRNAILISSGYGATLDFLAQPNFAGGGKDGGVILADNSLYPGVIGNREAMLVGFLGPCGMVAPHSHMRATEILYNVAGPPLTFGAITEGGGPTVTGQANPGTAIILPEGSTHYIQNSGCTPTVIVAVFNSEDPGALFVSAEYTAFTEQTFSAAFGKTVTMVDPSQIPNSVNLGTKSCQAKCGIDASSFDLKGVSNRELLNAAYAGYLSSKNYSWA